MIYGANEWITATPMVVMIWRSNFHDPFQNTNILADNGYINSFYPVNLVTDTRNQLMVNLTKNKLFIMHLIVLQAQLWRDSLEYSIVALIWQWMAT
jgi:hypothetical protein